MFLVVASVAKSGCAFTPDPAFESLGILSSTPCCFPHPTTRQQGGSELCKAHEICSAILNEL